MVIRFRKQQYITGLSLYVTVMSKCIVIKVPHADSTPSLSSTLPQVFDREGQSSSSELSAHYNMAALLSSEAVPGWGYRIRAEHRGHATPSRLVQCKASVTTHKLIIDTHSIVSNIQTLTNVFKWDPMPPSINGWIMWVPKATYTLRNLQ